MKSVFSILFFCLPLLMIAQFGESKLILPNYNGPDRAINIDLDNDGDKDLLATSSELTWYENLDGKGTYALPKILDKGSNLYNLNAVDLDLDGDIDIILMNWDFMYWYENTGNGIFSEGKLITEVESYTRYMAIDDLNGDNLPDILIQSLDSTTMLWYPNLLPDGGFGAARQVDDQVESLVGEFSTDNFYQIEDVDADGDNDIMFMRREGIGQFFMKIYLGMKTKMDWGIL